MGEETHEMHSGDDKALLDKNKKRKVKTPAQVQALEQFYNEHKYPSEPMKIQFADSIGLTEKQISGWFCHRRLKDKKLNEDKHVTIGKQDRSSGVIQDHGSGHRQDSCGSTKQGDDRNLDTREVESERLTPKDFSTAHHMYEHKSHRPGIYNRTDDVSSGSSSSMSNHQIGVLPFDAETTSRYPVPKFHAGEKTRSGPSGYLKVKSRVENSAVTEVKRQLGKHYREDGPPLGVDFDLLPPGAFESAPIQDPAEEAYYSGDTVLPSPSGVSRKRQNPNFVEGCEFKPSTAPDNPKIDIRSFKTRPTYNNNIPESHSRQKFRKHASLPDSGVYYPRSNSSLEFPGGSSSSRDITGGENRDEYGTRVRPRAEVMRTDSFLRNPNLQPYGRKVRDERAESWFPKYNGDVVPKVSLGENSENEYSNLAVKDNEYYSSGDKGPSRQIIQDGKTMYPCRMMANENPVNVPFKNDSTASKRTREEFPQQQYLKRPSSVDNEPLNYQVVRSSAEMPSGFSEDEESAETSSSVD